MNKQLETVKEFMITFDQPVLNLDDEIAADRAKLRLNIILEELHELSIALKQEQHLRDQMLNILSKPLENYSEDKETIDIEEVVDALADITYVVNGTILECGLGEVFDECFDEVHSSNMSKTVNGIDILDKEITRLKKQNIDFAIKPVNSGYVIVRTKDNKVIKPSTYRPVDFRAILKAFRAKRARQTSMEI
jgi:predicted HAD superfamily Cof-like phosphohydrolase